ncbi:cell division FtsA domain-containing protein [Tepidanaerobacter syntrophicus]|uniref:cell division FtsA domain-containing protein n=1 Tax=Tepidanaerobacter syntrophicus TaxID=224999 RepID=UPI00235568D8|nr:cell division FtsA domain-containing protein [Tepidanaerobacter syntrophicus]
MNEERQEVFALDIGTRTIVGLVMECQGKTYSILANKVIEHESRAMYDGRIHDVEAVSRSVNIVKSQLEKTLNRKLEKAAVAAAGRALYTVEAAAERKISPFIEITDRDIRSLETEALSKAIKLIGEKAGNLGSLDNCYCVGFSPIKWYLEDEPLDSLLGQKGKSMSVKIVATFLPRAVVESILTVLSKCKLGLESLTLEPIAAGDVVILPGMRKLNVALVDIGAGTSDIAISRDGSIFAYGMVPMAGDEITERICEEFLLSFEEGERVKRELSKHGKVKFQDILGSKKEIDCDKIIEAVRPTINEISSNIARKIFELNGRAPAAVLLVGGGSLMPGLCEAIAANLEIPKERVGIKGRESLTNISGGEDLTGPFSITPIGIAVNSIKGAHLASYKVYVDDQPVNILAQNSPTVLNALLYAGKSSAEIFGRPGMAKTFKLNGKLKIIKGKMAEPASVTINGKSVNLNEPVYDGAVINFMPAKDGISTNAKIREYISEEDKLRLKINGRDFTIDPIIKNGDTIMKPEDDIPDEASITVERRKLILSDIFNLISFKPEGISGRLIIKINGIDAGFADPIQDQDEIEIYWEP